MKLTLLNIFIIWGICVEAKIIPGESKISEVIVYKDRAFVTRTRNLILSPGGYSIRFPNVTSILDKDSLKVQIPNQAGKVSLLGIRTESQYYLKSEDEELEKYKLNLQTLMKEKEQLWQKVSVLIKEHQSMEQLSSHYSESFTQNLHENKWTAKGFRNFIGLLNKRSQQMFGKWKKSYREFLSLLEKIEYTENQIRTLEGPAKYQRVSLYVDLKVIKKTKFNVKVQYLVTNAGWKPLYDIRIVKNKKSASFEQHAVVWQNTGEDWKNVKLTLSNIREELRTNPPTLSAYTISYRKVEKTQTTIKTSMQEAESLVSGVATQDQKEIKGLAKSFLVKNKQTLASGAPQTKLFLNKKVFPFKEHLEVVASEFNKVYRKATFTNQFKFTLAPAWAAIFYDGEYIQKFWLDEVPKEGVFYANVGYVPDIVVKRTFKAKTGNAGLINQKRTYKRDFNHHIENFSSLEKTVRILDQVPESEIKSVEVTIKSDQKYKKLKDHPSWIYWDLKLKPFKAVNLGHSLEVRAPKDFKFNW